MKDIKKKGGQSRITPGLALYTFEIQMKVQAPIM